MRERSSESGRTVFDGDITLPFRIVCSRKETSNEGESQRDDEGNRVERARAENSRE